MSDRLLQQVKMLFLSGCLSLLITNVRTALIAGELELNTGLLRLRRGLVALISFTSVLGGFYHLDFDFRI